ncbi:protein of unknown function [Denitratisoma oestradiolicum]|uniref:Uncharacterized protein n=1 Tax=Denitratisoma oestradiolicum TaxID=311182 RepID=A0A6S6XWB0_9PROT|nr:protein of unknown function [Denitratisoma oestradiolicum]
MDRPVARRLSEPAVGTSGLTSASGRTLVCDLRGNDPSLFQQFINVICADTEHESIAPEKLLRALSRCLRRHGCSLALHLIGLSAQSGSS